MRMVIENKAINPSSRKATAATRAKSITPRARLRTKQLEKWSLTNQKAKASTKATKKASNKIEKLNMM